MIHFHLRLYYLQNYPRFVRSPQIWMKKEILKADSTTLFHRYRVEEGLEWLERKAEKRERNYLQQSRAGEGGVNYRFVSVHEPGAHNFILSSLGLYLDLLAGRWTRYFGFIYGPRHAAAKVASVASALTKSGGGTIEKIRFISRPPIADSRSFRK